MITFSFVSQTNPKTAQVNNQTLRCRTNQKSVPVHPSLISRKQTAVQADENLMLPLHLRVLLLLLSSACRSDERPRRARHPYPPHPSTICITSLTSTIKTSLVSLHSWGCIRLLWHHSLFNKAAARGDKWSCDVLRADHVSCLRSYLIE